MFVLGVKLLLGALGFAGLVPLWFAVAAGDDGVTMLLLFKQFASTSTQTVRDSKELISP
jgi:hypothetical protein